jgi:hypothetical protein
MRVSILLKDRQLIEQIDDVLLLPRYVPIVCEITIEAALDWEADGLANRSPSPATQGFLAGLRPMKRPLLPRSRDTHTRHVCMKLNSMQ